MNYKLNIFADAIEDIKEIKKYLARFYPGTVKKFVDLYKKQTSRVKENPCIFERFADDPEYRKAAAGEYLIFYMVSEEKKTVEIHRVLYGARDIKRHLS